MDRIITGKQSNDYFKEYYIKNKERIRARNKAKYQKDRENPEKLLKHRAKSTEHTRNYRKRHPDRVKTLRQKQYVSRKQRVMDIVGERYGGAKCCSCDCDYLPFLEVNHINGGGCKEWRENSKGLYDRILNGERGVSDLEVLCRICNAKDHLFRKDNFNGNRFTIVWK